MAKQKITRKVKKTVDEYINVLKKDRLPINRVIIFGSQAKHSARQDSDIDVCVISPKFKDDFKALHYLLMKSYEVEGMIEPHPFHPKEFVDDDPLVWEIKRTGVIVK
ncbi:MAG: nucleotidyltransferase domain-containing protein [bacterium]